MAESSTYLIKRAGRIEGPWSLEKILAEIQLRKLARYHKVSSDGGATWRRVSECLSLCPPSSAKKVVGKDDAETAGAGDSSVQSADAVDPDGWYCMVDGTKQGPMTFVTLSELADAGKLSLEDLVWHEDLGDWVCAEQVRQLAGPLKLETNVDAANDATRMVAVPTTTVLNQVPQIIGVTGVILMMASCLPVIGLLGIVPCVAGIVTALKLRSQQAPGVAFACAGAATGAIGVLVGFVSMVCWMLWFNSYFN